MTAMVMIPPSSALARGTSSSATNQHDELEEGHNHKAITGSHNIVLGKGHTVTSHGGIVSGVDHVTSGPHASAIAGSSNTVSGAGAISLGGDHGTASGEGSSVSGGFRSAAKGAWPYSSVSGGLLNTVSGRFSSVSGDELNTASGHASSVSGGKDNNASASIGPFVRLLDANFTVQDVRDCEITLSVVGDDGFSLEAASRMSEISRDPLDLVAQTIGDFHQYPDGLMLYLGTMFAPVQDRGSPGDGFTHKVGDVVSISTPAIGNLINQVDLATNCTPWIFGTAALMRSLAIRRHF